jgi:hypothetical protein
LVRVICQVTLPLDGHIDLFAAGDGAHARSSLAPLLSSLAPLLRVRPTRQRSPSRAGAAMAFGMAIREKVLRCSPRRE